MPIPVSRSDLNIQEKLKTTSGPPLEAQVKLLARRLHSPHWLGEILQILARRLACSHSTEPYTDRELAALLTLTLALKRAGMWP